MELLSLEIDRNDSVSYNDLVSILTNIKNSNISILCISQNNGYDKIVYCIEDLTQQNSYLAIIIDNITAMIKEYIKHKCNEYLYESYFYFEDNETDILKENICEEVDNDIKNSILLKNILHEYLQHNNEINIFGFISFRLKYIINYVQQLVEKCIDNYLIKKEYNNFISIMKYFSEEDNSTKESINIIYKNDKLQIYDDNMKKLSLITDVEFSQELETSKIFYDESIINLIITISPKKIILHIPDKLENINDIAKNTLEIINKLFIDKIKFCIDCEFCRI